MAVSREFLNFQENTKRTALGLRFGTTLVQNPDSLTTAQITNTIRALGLPLSPEMEVTADLAQAWVTGSTLVDQFEAANSVQSFASPAAGTIKLLQQLGRENGLLSADASSQMTVIGSTARLFASGGLDVTAWITLATEVGFSQARNEVVAKSLAMKGLADTYKAIISPEADNLTRAIQALSKDEVGVFGFLTMVADNSPHLFESSIIKNPALQGLREKFPGLQFIPIFNQTITGIGTSTNWMGYQSEHKESITLRTLHDMNRAEAMNFIFNNVFFPMMAGYIATEDKLRVQKKAGFTANALIACLNSKQVQISSSRDILARLSLLRLTPWDLGESFINQVSVNSSKDSAISFFGFKKEVSDMSRDEMIAADRSGDISKLLKSQAARSAIENYFDLSSVKLAYDWVYPNQSDGSFQTLDLKPIQNFIALLNMLDLLINDPFYKQYQNEMPSLNSIAQIFPRANEFYDRISYLASLSQVRKVNRLALSNVAYYLGASSPQNIQNISGLRDGKASVFQRSK